MERSQEPKYFQFPYTSSMDGQTDRQTDCDDPQIYNMVMTRDFRAQSNGRLMVFVRPLNPPI